MAHKNHSRSGRFATIGSTSVKSFRGAGGSTGRSRETLNGFFLIRAQRFSESPADPRYSSIAQERVRIGRGWWFDDDGAGIGRGRFSL